jgi:pimeloyl-ACP methyl ester carboxylesterase
MMSHLVFLPATEPGDDTYGLAPEHVTAYPEISVHQVSFPSLVWYNQAAQSQAVAQIRDLITGPVILVGFSKSGLGAWNIARTIPDLVQATIIFDAPVAREQLPPWETAAFYDSDESWRKDLPIHLVEEFQSAMPPDHSLVLISGEGFHDEMCALSRAASDIELDHVFLSRPHQTHNWQSGWIDEGLAAIL